MSQPTQSFAAPKPGDIVWCRFPNDKSLRPGPKARPALVLNVGRIDDQIAVQVAYGTSQKVERLFPGEFAITPDDNAAFAVSGLSYPTKFNLGNAVELPFSERWFGVPPGMPFGQHPKLGILHPSLMRRAEAAYRASQETLK
jgi:hypothetical protein